MPQLQTQQDSRVPTPGTLNILPDNCELPKTWSRSQLNANEMARNFASNASSYMKNSNQTICDRCWLNTCSQNPRFRTRADEGRTPSPGRNR